MSSNSSTASVSNIEIARKLINTLTETLAPIQITQERMKRFKSASLSPTPFEIEYMDRDISNIRDNIEQLNKRIEELRHMCQLSPDEFEATFAIWNHKHSPVSISPFINNYLHIEDEDAWIAAMKDRFLFLVHMHQFRSRT